MDDKNSKLFRQKSIDRISSPEKLDDYIKVATPGIWIVLIAITVLLVGFLVWGCTAKLQTTVKGVVTSDNGVINCFVPEKYVENGVITTEMNVSVNDKTYKITQINDDSLEAYSVLTDYAIHLGGFENGEWVSALSLDCDSLEDGTYAAVVIVNEVSPISFLLDS